MSRLRVVYIAEELPENVLYSIIFCICIVSRMHCHCIVDNHVSSFANVLKLQVMTCLNSYCI